MSKAYLTPADRVQYYHKKLVAYESAFGKCDKKLRSQIPFVLDLYMCLKFDCVVGKKLSVMLVRCEGLLGRMLRRADGLNV